MLLFNHEPTPTIEKLMTVTRHEFELGLSHMTGEDPVRRPDGGYDMPTGSDGKRVFCTFEPQADAVLGHLLRLPRALVTLHLEHLSVPEREAFVTHFDRHFQRGGG